MSEAPSLLAAARARILYHEGKRLRVYRDTKGIPTIGVGFNLERPDARKLCQQCGADYDVLLAGTVELTDAQCEFLFKQSLIDVIEDLTRIFGSSWNSIDVRRQAVLADMRFQLGPAGFRTFEHFIWAVKMHDWPEAATQLLSSELAHQTPARCIDNAGILERG